MGNLFNFALTWLWTKKFKGKLSLRIDDVDFKRSKKIFIEDIFRILDWLDIDYDEGPCSVDSFYKKHSQSLRIEKYQDFLNELQREGLKTYFCDCSRKDIFDRTGHPLYDGNCRSKNVSFLENKTSLRVNLSNQKEIIQNDFVIWTKDGIPSYQLVSLFEDYENKINFIVRGDDLFESGQIQSYLGRFKEDFFKNKIKIFYHGLLLDDFGRKMSKSAASSHTQSLIYSNDAKKKLINLLTNFIGIKNRNIKTLQELLYEICLHD